MRRVETGWSRPAPRVGTWPGLERPFAISVARPLPGSPRPSDPGPWTPDPGLWTPPHLAERILTENEALEARAAPDGESKTITALFADIKGSMEIIEDLDPEEAHQMLAEIHGWFTEGFDTVDLKEAKSNHMTLGHFPSCVIPAKAGIYCPPHLWIPACAGMTE